GSRGTGSRPAVGDSGAFSFEPPALRPSEVETCSTKEGEVRERGRPTVPVSGSVPSTGREWSGRPGHRRTREVSGWPGMDLELFRAIESTKDRDREYASSHDIPSSRVASDQ